jgi:hypothetical protein
MLAGHPLAANSQSAAWNPFTLIACLLPAAVSFTFTASIALFLGALGAFLLARELDCGEVASVVAAAGWAFAASTVVYIHTSMGFTSVYEPMLLLAALRVARNPSLRSGALLTAVLALMIVAGHPETLFLAVIAGGAFGIFELVRRRRNWLQAPAVAIVSGLAALAVTAIHLLPFFDALQQSAELAIKRGSYSTTIRSLPGDRVLAVLATDLFPWLHVRNWEEPAFGLTQAETAAVGSVVLALALYAVWRRRSPETWFFFGTAAVCVLVESGWHPVVSVVQRLPLMGLTHYERLAFTAALALSILAALGVDEMLRRNDRRGIGLTVASVLMVLGAGTWWLRQHVVLLESPTDFGRFKLFAELFFLVAALASIAGMRNVRRLGILLTAIVILQRAISEEGTFPTFPARSAYPPLDVLAPTAGASPPFRIVGHRYALLPATGTFYGLEDVRGWEALTFMPFVHTWPLWCEFQVIWFNRVDDLTRPFLSFLNVRYAISGENNPVPPGWREVARANESILLENERVAPRVFVPSRVVIGESVVNAVRAMDRQQDFGERAWITADMSPHERTNGPGKVVIREYSPGGRFLLDVDMAGDGWIVISENAWRGWRAYVDGRRVRMQYANVSFLGLFVEKGRHTVRLVYWPDAFVNGRAITAGTLGLFVAVAVWRRRSNRRP